MRYAVEVVLMVRRTKKFKEKHLCVFDVRVPVPLLIPSHYITLLGTIGTTQAAPVCIIHPSIRESQREKEYRKTNQQTYYA